MKLDLVLDKLDGIARLLSASPGIAPGAVSPRTAPPDPGPVEKPTAEGPPAAAQALTAPLPVASKQLDEEYEKFNAQERERERKKLEEARAALSVPFAGTTANRSPVQTLRVAANAIVWNPTDGEEQTTCARWLKELHDWARDKHGEKTSPGMFLRVATRYPFDAVARAVKSIALMRADNYVFKKSPMALLTDAIKKPDWQHREFSVVSFDEVEKIIWQRKEAAK